MEEYVEIPLEEFTGPAAEEVSPEESEESLEDVMLKEILMSVSGNVPNTVSGNVVVDNFVDYSTLLTDMYMEVQTLKKEDPTIWDKPLEDYTVAEGLLLLIFVLLLAWFIGSMFRKGERYV